MIVFLIYALVIGWLIYKNGFWGLFNDAHLNKRTLLLVFIIKVLAVPAFYLFFKFYYGGITKLDAGKFYSDATVMNDLAYVDFAEYLKMLVGLQDDTPGSFFFNHCIETTNNWENGQVKDFFYNDNRVVIRLHSLIHFIAFKSYFVHALFSCFFSYIGLFFIYKTLKEFFLNKELYLYVMISLFPTLWLYSGGLLKEGITLLFFGLLLFQIKKIVRHPSSVKTFLMLIPLLFISVLLKPYLLFYGAVFFMLFFIIQKHIVKYKTGVFMVSLLLACILINFSSILLKKQSLLQAAQKREQEFMDLSKGGIFLLDSIKFVRVAYDTNRVKRVKDKPEHFTIKKGIAYTYWEHSHQQDTLICSNNEDTLTHYSLVYMLPKAGSVINVIDGSNNFAIIALRSFYYTILHPFFFNAKGLMQQFASLENLLLILALLTSVLGIICSRDKKLPGIAFLLFGLSLFILIGFTTPNSGAIMRYRAPAAIFILMSALYFLEEIKLFLRKIFN